MATKRRKYIRTKKVGKRRYTKSRINKKKTKRKTKRKTRYKMKSTNNSLNNFKNLKNKEAYLFKKIIEKGSYNELELILNKFPEFKDIKDKQKKTLLILAYSIGQTDYVKLLIKIGVDPNIKDSKKYTALMYATENGNVNMVKILAGSSKNSNKTIMNALEIAMSTNKKQIFKILLNSTNLNLNQSDMTWAGKTILIKAITDNVDIQYIDMLLSNGVDVNVGNKYGRTEKGKTPLFYVLKSTSMNSQEKEDLITKLIKNGADVNKAPDNNSTMTPLSLAKFSESMAKTKNEKDTWSNIVKLLEKAGAK